MFAAAGVILNELTATISKDGNLIYNVSALASRLYYGGQATVSSVSTNDITINTPSIKGVPGATASNIFFANEPVIVYNNSTGASRGTTTVSSISSNVVTVAATPSSTDADDVILPTISSAAVSTLSPISMKNSKVYMAASGTSSASLFASGNQVTVQSADVTINRDIQTPGLQDLTGSVYPSADYIVGNDVSITGSFTLNAQPNQLSAASRFVDQDLMAIGIQVDNGSDQFIRFFMPYSRNRGHGWRLGCNLDGLVYRCEREQERRIKVVLSLNTITLNSGRRTGRSSNCNPRRFRPSSGRSSGILWI